MNKPAMNRPAMNRPVVTGQQIGLLGGPLYTTYKVLGAVYHAREAGEDAIYWLETNDADFSEINHIDYLDARGRLRTLTWDIHSGGYSCGFIPVDQTLTALLEEFFSTLRQTEFTPGLRELALDCYTPGRTLEDASRQLARELYGDLGIRIFTPFETDFRRFSRDLLLNEALQTPEGQQCNLFCMVGKQRKALFRSGDGFRLRDGETVDPTDPGRHDLVPGLKTRSVCQDAYFHTGTYVAGPGEVKYLAELGPVYRRHGVEPAVVRPRMSLLLLEPRVRRLLGRTGLTRETVETTDRDRLLKDLLQNRTPLDFDAIRDKSNRLTGEYIDQLRGLGFDEGDLKKLDRRLRQEVKECGGKLRAREKETHRQLLADAGELSDHLRPFGKPQERVFNIFYYMNLFGGRDFIRRLHDAYHPDRRVLEL